MSTYQPPGGQPTDGPAAYPQPQDPWASEHGLASVPTDPIPQQYGGYTQGDVWSQQTVAHGGQYDYAPAPAAQRSRTGLVLAIFFAVLVLGGGGGFAAWYITKHRADGVTVPPTTPPAATTPVKAAFDPNSVNVGDCLVNKASSGPPDISVVACTTQGSFKILKIAKGEDIPEGPDGKLGSATSTSECAGTGFNRWYAYDDSDNTKDVFFCLKDN